MKKHLLILACACFTLASCGDINKEETGEKPGLEELPGIGNNEGNDPTEELAPDQQQAKLQSVGEKLLAEFPAESFETIATIAEEFEKTYNKEGYDLSEFEEWMRTVTETAYIREYDETSIENEYHSISKKNLLILLSNHTGLFTFGPDKVTVSPFEGTKAVFNLNGKNYEAEISSSGAVTTGYYKYEYHCIDNYVNNYVSDGVLHKVKVDREALITIGVPENVSITIKEEGTPLATVNAKFNLNISSEQVQFSTDAFAAEFTILINGYEFKLNRTGYEGPASKAQMMATISGNGTTLITAVGTADLFLSNKTVESSYVTDYQDVYTTETQIVFEKFENFKVAMDILGEIQVTGTCTDMNKFDEEYNIIVDALMYDNSTRPEPNDEEVAAEHTKNINELTEFGVYYDNGSNKQADIEFEYFYEYEEWMDDWGYIGSSYQVGIHPVIVFNNGTRNKIEDFFTESAFGNLIDLMNEFVDSYTTVFGYFFE